MKTKGWETFQKQIKRVCPICGQEFSTTSRRRLYCYNPACDDQRYENKLAKRRKGNRKRNV